LDHLDPAGHWQIKKGFLYLVSVVRERMDYPTLKRKIKDYAQSHSAHTILIEDKGSGTSLIQDLRAENQPVIARRPHTDKVMRMATAAVYFESGQVFLLGSWPWIDELELELLAFPYGRHDDQVDSISQFLNWYRERQLYKEDTIAPCIQAY
jgi:predicted phage terminase large subunit-like protein